MYLDSWIFFKIKIKQTSFNIDYICSVFIEEIYKKIIRLIKKIKKTKTMYVSDKNKIHKYPQSMVHGRWFKGLKEVKVFFSF